MTIRDRIVALLVAQPSLTNRQIAEKLSLPEPSVRRMTRSLEDGGVLEANFVGTANTIRWSMQAPVDPQPVQESASL